MATPLDAFLTDARAAGVHTDQLPCVTTTDVDWHSDHAGERRLAAWYCVTQACPLLDACLAFARATGERHGTWGGVDVESAYRRDHTGTGKPPKPCGTEAAYLRHRRHGEDPCAACSAAHVTYCRERREARRAAAS